MRNCTSFCFLWRRNTYVPHHIQGKRYQCPHDPNSNSWMNFQSPQMTVVAKTDHSELLSVYQMFDHYLDENSIKWPVVVLSHGHSSRFDCDVLTFLRGKKMRLFITPPGTTGITQLLDQINQKLHSEYSSTKSELFTLFMKINREGFMKTIAVLWPEWAS